MEFNNFNHVEHMPLRVFNRAVFATNLVEDFGVEAAKEYFSTFAENERKQIFLMLSYIKKMGVEQTKKFVTKDLITEYNPMEDINVGD